MDRKAMAGLCLLLGLVGFVSSVVFEEKGIDIYDAMIFI